MPLIQVSGTLGFEDVIARTLSLGEAAVNEARLVPGRIHLRPPGGNKSFSGVLGADGVIRDLQALYSFMDWVVGDQVVVVSDTNARPQEVIFATRRWYRPGERLPEHEDTRRLSLSHQAREALRKLERAGGRRLTVSDLIERDLTKLIEHPPHGFGLKPLQALWEVANAACARIETSGAPDDVVSPPWTPDDVVSPPWSADETSRLLLSNARLRMAAFPFASQKALRKLAANGARPLDAWDVATLDLAEFLRHPPSGFGPGSIERMRAIIRRVHADSRKLTEAFQSAPAADPQAPYEGDARFVIEDRSLPLSDVSFVPHGSLRGAPENIASILMEDVFSWLSSIGDPVAHIMRGRLGLQDEERTLEALAQPLGLTRERIRQLENKGRLGLTDALRTPHAALATYLIGLSGEQLLKRFSSVRADFASDRGLLRFLELCAGLEANTLVEQQLGKTSVPIRVFEELFAATPAPVSVDACLAAISEATQLDAPAVRYRLQELERQGDVRIDGDAVTAQRLTHGAAIAHVLLSAGDATGLPWDTIIRLVNEWGLTTNPVGLRLSVAFDPPWSWQCGRGRYAHRSFVRDAELARGPHLARVRKLLVAEGGTANLLALVRTADAEVDDDYWILRHLVREFGLEVDIHFSGTSGIDMIALHQPPDVRKGLVHILVAELERDGPLSMTALSARLNRKREHIKDLLSQAVEPGGIVRFNEQLWWTLERATSAADRTRFGNALASFLGNDARPVTVGLVWERVAAELELPWSPELIRSVAAALADEHDWTVLYSLVIPSHSPKDSLGALVREVVKRDAPREQQVEALGTRVRGRRSDLLTAIRNGLDTPAFPDD